MNNFLIYNKNASIGSVKNPLRLTEDWSLYIPDTEYLEFYSENNSRILIIGDPVDTVEKFKDTKPTDIPKLRGNFYALIIQSKTLRVFSSFLNVLPLYHTENKLVISSSVEILCRYNRSDFTVDKKFILESLLFNYGFFNRTLFKEITLLPCHSYFNIEKEDVKIEKHFSTLDLISQKPDGGRKIANTLSDLFIETAQHYFPNKPFDIAFTSGFDGRTLVSCATHYNKNFSTFSFGKSENDDVSIPKQNAAALDIPYRYYDLGGSNYIEKEFYKNATNYNKSIAGGNGFIYAHFLYSTKKIKTTSNYLLSGVFGSELFRALHLTGAVTSSDLAKVFTIANANQLKEALLGSKTLEVINIKEYQTELEELIDEVIDYKSQLPKAISLNQQFYIFVFEEICRKFFGQWIALQMQQINVRSPFLDYEFIKALMQTSFAGANNDFFTENPFKRMKGQYIYADIIKKTNQSIYKQKTGKGYRPKDVREPFYLYKIVWPFIQKRLKRKVKKVNLDNLGIISGTNHHQEELTTLLEKNNYFDPQKLGAMLDDLSAFTPEKQRDTLLMAFSILNSINQLPTQISTNE